MINVLERKDEPRATVRCTNCDSLLDYGNSDLITESVDNQISISYRHYLECPVCKVNFIAKFVKKNGE